MRAGESGCDDAFEPYMRMYASVHAAIASCHRGRWVIPPDEWRAFHHLLGPSDRACVVALGMIGPRAVGR